MEAGSAGVRVRPDGGALRIHGVPPSILDRYWNGVRDFIQSALDRNDNCYETDDIKELCLSGDMQLWVVVDNELIGAYVTHIKKYPRKKVLEIVLGGGKRLEEWAGKSGKLSIEFARENGCDFIDIIGRKGWGKVYPDLAVRHEVLRKVL